MKTIRKLVKPNKLDVAYGVAQNAMWCPYARAARRVLRKVLDRHDLVTYVNPGPGVRWWTVGNPYEGTQPLPPAVKQRIKDFDNLISSDRSSPWPGFYLTIEVQESQGGEP